MDNYQENRKNMKSYFNRLKETDQQKGLKQPELVKSFDENATIIELPVVSDEMEVFNQRDFYFCVDERETRRLYDENEQLTGSQLSYLLWATQGVKGFRPDKTATLRTVPSAGARHALETYLVVRNVKGLKPGLYRYLPVEHSLLLEYEDENIKDKMVDASAKQIFVGKAAVTFIWTSIPYRTEWRYRDMAYKSILLDAGHVCHGLYLACEALGLGTCAIAAYDQEKTDELLGLDGLDEMAIYMAPVGIKAQI